MDPSKVETAIRLLEKYRNEIWKSGEDVNSQITAALCELRGALFEPDADNGDNTVCLRFDQISDQPSDYEIRLKAWNIVNDCLWETGNDEFSATLDAATKLYNFLSGQNEDVK